MYRIGIYLCTHVSILAFGLRCRAASGIALRRASKPEASDSDAKDRESIEAQQPVIAFQYLQQKPDLRCAW